MRQNTKMAVSLLSLGILGTSWGIGQAAETQNFATDGGGLAPSADATGQTEAPSASATPAPSESSSASPSGTKKPETAPSSKPKPTKTKATATTTIKTGDAITYKYGVVQVEIAKTGGKIKDVTLIQATASPAQKKLFPALVNAAVQANGSGFGNATGATYTVDAFKKAVDSALAKF